MELYHSCRAASGNGPRNVLLEVCSCGTWPQDMVGRCLGHSWRNSWRRGVRGIHEGSTAMNNSVLWNYIEKRAPSFSRWAGQAQQPPLRNSKADLSCAVKICICGSDQWMYWTCSCGPQSWSCVQSLQHSLKAGGHPESPSPGAHETLSISTFPQLT